MNFRARLSLFALETRETPGSVPVVDPYVTPDPTPTTDPATTAPATPTDPTATTPTDPTTTPTDPGTGDGSGGITLTPPSGDPLLDNGSITKVPLVY